ncbi:MAG: hypothetical protein SNJ79_01350 [Sphingomonadaceae bacterium]
MFRIVKNLVAPWPASIRIVKADGAVEEQRFTLHFRRISNARFEELFNTMNFPDSRTQDSKIMEAVVAGWDGIVGEDGEPLPDTPENRRFLLDFPGFGPALGVAYARFHMAQPEEREKNSEPSPGGGPAAAGRPVLSSSQNG